MSLLAYPHCYSSGSTATKEEDADDDDEQHHVLLLLLPAKRQSFPKEAFEGISPVSTCLDVCVFCTAIIFASSLHPLLQLT